MINLIIELIVFTSVIYIYVLSFIVGDFLIVAVFWVGAFLVEVERRLHVAAEGGLVMVVRTYELVFVYFLFYYEIIVVVFLFLVLVGLGVLEVIEGVHFV